MNTGTAGLIIDESDDDEQTQPNNVNIHHNNTQLSYPYQQQHNAAPSAPDQKDQEADEEEEEQKYSHSQLHSQSYTHNDDEYDDEDDEEEEELPISDVITMLTISWRNEKLAPEILEYEGEYVERVKAALEDKELEIDEMNEQIANKCNAGNIDNNKMMAASIDWYKKEMQRIRYILHSYLRVRLWKIQRYLLHILSDADAYNRLSAAEQKFATAYSDIGETHFKNCFLRDLPTKYRSITDPEMFVRPNLNQFVVIKANENRDDIMIEDNKHHVQLQKGNIFVSRYHNFRSHIASGSVDLI
eukprot:CAMPEP_0197025746 /NCGR_PEP_ID=MMETSP1384-20130603/5973_1 /TAXON_ID=29189 /ORGANISM="Ammonia sp." /LENGTH=300 /DNA_ID=CAMNT_0042454317 /DNA_START=93 /DNA_END=995 /DNA_ORIENTATION=+